MGGKWSWCLCLMRPETWLLSRRTQETGISTYGSFTKTSHVPRTAHRAPGLGREQGSEAHSHMTWAVFSGQDTKNVALQEAVLSECRRRRSRGTLGPHTFSSGDSWAYCVDETAVSNGVLLSCASRSHAISTVSLDLRLSLRMKCQVHTWKWPNVKRC